MNKDLVKAIQLKSANDEVFKHVCELFAQRQRARTRVTVKTIQRVLAQQGKTYSKEQVSNCFRYLASLSVGKIDNGMNGKLRSLKDIQYSLQSIGLAGQGSVAPLQQTKLRKHYTNLEPKNNILVQRKGSVVVLSLIIDGQELKLPIPRVLSREELGLMLAELYIQYPVSQPGMDMTIL